MACLLYQILYSEHKAGRERSNLCYYVFTANYKGAGAKVAEDGDFEATILDPTVPAAGESYRPRFYIEYGKKDATGDFISVLPEQRATAAYVVE